MGASQQLEAILVLFSPVLKSKGLRSNGFVGWWHLRPSWQDLMKMVRNRKPMVLITPTPQRKSLVNSPIHVWTACLTFGIPAP
jgi:hypothetical protein